MTHTDQTVVDEQTVSVQPERRALADLLQDQRADAVHNRDPRLQEDERA